MSNESTSGASAPGYKSVSIKKFNAAQWKQMEEHITAMFRDGWELIQCSPFTDFGPVLPNETFQRASTAFQVMMCKRNQGEPNARFA